MERTINEDMADWDKRLREGRPTSAGAYKRRIAELEAALRTVRAAIIEKADDTFWLTSIETVVDRIDAALGGYADAQAKMII